MSLHGLYKALRCYADARGCCWHFSFALTCISHESLFLSSLTKSRDNWFQSLVCFSLVISENHCWLCEPWCSGRCARVGKPRSISKYIGSTICAFLWAGFDIHQTSCYLSAAACKVKKNRILFGEVQAVLIAVTKIVLHVGHSGVIVHFHSSQEETIPQNTLCSILNIVCILLSVSSKNEAIHFLTINYDFCLKKKFLNVVFNIN